MFSKSKRERMVYLCFIAWFFFGTSAIVLNTFFSANVSIGELAGFLAALSPFIMTER